MLFKVNSHRSGTDHNAGFIHWCPSTSIHWFRCLAIFWTDTRHL